MLSLVFLALVVVLFVVGYFSGVKLHRHILAIFLSWLIVVVPTVLWIVWSKNNALAVISNSGFPAVLAIFSKLLFVSTLAIFTWGLVKKAVLDFQINGIWPLLILYIAIALAFAGIIFQNSKTNDFAFYSFIIAGVIISLSRLIYSLRFWVLELVALLVFTIWTIVESLLTNISFFDQFNIANLLFGFAFVGLFVVVFNWLDEKWSTSLLSNSVTDNNYSNDPRQNQYSFMRGNNTTTAKTVVDTPKKTVVNNQPEANLNRVENSINNKGIDTINRKYLRPSSKLTTALYDLKNRRRNDYILQESYFKMPSFRFEQGAPIEKK